MNICIFSPFRSHPQDKGSSIRIYNIAKYLQRKGCRIHFVYHDMQDGINLGSYAAMNNCWDTFTHIPRRDHFNPNGLKKRFSLDEAFSENIGQAIKTICDLFEIDIILCHYIFYSKLLEYVPDGVIKIIDTIDKFSNRNELLIKNGDIDKSMYWFSYSKADEAKALNRADMILAIQNNEKKFFESITKKPVYLLQHLQDKQYIKNKYTSLKKIGFMGTWNIINLKAIMNFIDVFIESPLDCKLFIAGNICKKINIEHKKIHKSGYIDKLQGFYEDVDLVINPQLFGTGLKIKTIEALAHGVPVVSTKVGFEGIQSPSRYHVAENNSEIMDLLKEISLDPETKLNALAKLSRQIYDEYYDNVLKNIDHIFAIDRFKTSSSPSIFKTHLDNKFDNDTLLAKKENDILNLYRKLQTIKFHFNYKHDIYNVDNKSSTFNNRSFLEIKLKNQINIQEEIIQGVYNSTSYRLGQFLLKPAIMIKMFLNKNFTTKIKSNGC